MKITVKDFCIWSICWLIFLIALIVFLSGIDVPVESIRTTVEQKKTFLEILSNNSYNFLLYFFLFPLNILLTIYEILMMGVSFYLGFRIYGGTETILRLLPHAVFEFPNILFYSFLSFHMFKSVLKFPKFQTIKQVLVDNRYYYLASYFVLVFAAWIEGGFQ